MVLENDQNGAENEGIFVPNQHSSPRRRQVSAIKVDFLRLGEGVLRLGKGVLRLGEGLHLGEGLIRLSEPKAVLHLGSLSSP